MTNENHNSFEHLLMYLEGELSEEAARRLEERLSRDVGLQEELSQLEALRSDVRRSRPDSFAPYFSDRVMRRLQPVPLPSGSIADSFDWIFARVGIAAAVLALVIGIYNAIQFGDLSVSSSIWEAALGLPSTDLIDSFLSGPI